MVTALKGKKQHNIQNCHSVSGEWKSLTPLMVNALWKTSLPTILSNYDLKYIYNVDEFGLFYQSFLNETYQLNLGKCSSGNLGKTHITGNAAADAIDGKSPMFVIGKTKKSRCVKNIKFLPCRNY